MTSLYVCSCKKTHEDLESKQKCEKAHQNCPWCHKTVPSKVLGVYPRFKVYQCPSGHKFARLHDISSPDDTV